MKNFYLSIILFFPLILQSQSVGDIAFIALNADGQDDFAFVTLTEISSGTVIYFTDNEWTGSAFNNTNEGTVTWTATTTLNAGTVVVITDAAGTESVNEGSVNTSGSFNIAASNDCLWALNASPATSYGSTPTFYGVICNDIANGDTVSGTGITPDIEIAENSDEFRIDTETDNQLEFAIKLLNG